MPQAVIESKREVEGAAKRVRTRTRPEDPAAGDVSLHVLDLAPGSRVAQAGAEVTGAAFYGRLANLQGARVSESPVVYAGAGATKAATSSESAFVVDFGRNVAVLGLELLEGGDITLVLPWLGTDFSPRPVYPAGPEKPNPGAGDESVGFPGVETIKLLVQVKGAKGLTAGTFPNRCMIETATLPANVRASLNGRLPFWTKPGQLDGKVELTGMAEDLNALVSGADEAVAVTLSLTTDAPGVLKVKPKPAEVDRSAQARWGSQPSTDVAVEALAPSPITVPFPSESTAPWLVTRLTLEATGAFPPWRAHHAQASTAPGSLSLRVDGAFSVARRLEVAQDAQLHGVALLLRTPGAEGELHVELVPDEAGAPGAAKPLAAAELALASGAPGEAWHEVLFASPIDVTAAAGAWLVVQARTGAAEWSAAPEAPSPATRTLGAAGGGRWDRYPPLGAAVAVAQARILRRPFATENEPLLELGWADGTGDVVRLDPGREATTVDLGRPASQPFAAADHVAVLSVAAAATGMLTLARATALYREGAA